MRVSSMPELICDLECLVRRLDLRALDNLGQLG